MRSEKAAGTKRKVRLFTASVFVIASAFVVSMLLYLGQSLASSLAIGFLVGVTAAVEVGWFGGWAFFAESDER